LRLSLTILPLIYMWLIWLQSSSFNPESIYLLTYKMDEQIFLMIGMVLEFGHLFEFGILYFLLIMMILSYGRLTKQKEWFCLLVAASYGLIDEVHQIYVPYRSFSFVDLLKNLIGIAVVWYIVHQSYFVRRSSTFGQKLKLITTYLNQ
jgi:polysaccharide biosynthesis protein VpsQ